MRAGAGLLVLTAAAACGGPPPWQGRADPERLLHLVAAPEARPPGPVRVVQSVAPPEGLDPWEVRSATPAAVRPDRHGTRALFGRGSATIEVPGPFAPEFDEIAVHLRTHRRIELAATARSSDGEALPPITEESSVAVEGHPETQTITFEVPGVRSQHEPLAGLVVVVTGQRPWSISSVDCVERPAAHWLPPPTAPELWEQAGEARLAVGLVPGRPLLARPAQVEPGSRLSFSLARPRGRPDPGTDIRVTVSADGRVLERVPVPGLGDASWQAYDLALGASGRTEIRFEVEGGNALLAEAAVDLPRRGAPTVLLVTSDTHRADHVASAPGAVNLRTPTLDALGREGTLFEQAWSATNITIPSHAALLTGVHPRDTGVLTNQDRLNEEAPTLAERFRDAGWVTWAVVSMRHLRHEHSGLGQGFARMSAPTGAERRAGVSIERLTSWLPEARGRPLFCWLHLNDAHAPYEAPPPWDRAYWHGERDPFDPSLPQPEGPPPPQQWRLRDYDWARAQYRGEISYLDQRLADLLAVPRIAGGIVAFTADHGESLGDVAVGWGHLGAWPQDLHVPLILRSPGGASGLRRSERVAMIDLGRTLLDLAGLEGTPFPGHSLTQARPAGGPAFAISDDAFEASITAGRWHLRLGLKDDHRRAHKNRPARRHVPELYDLLSDPECEVEVTEEAPEVVRRLRSELVDWLARGAPRGWRRETRLDARTQRELAQLGYAPAEEAEDAGEARPAYIDPDCGCAQCQRWR